MAYLTVYGSSTLIQSNIPAVGADCVSEFQRSWNLTEPDTMTFTVISPTTPILPGTTYTIWGDIAMTQKLGVCLVFSPNTLATAHHPYAPNGQEILLYKPNGAGPTYCLKRKKVSLQYSNIKISDLVKKVLEKAAIQFGVTTNYQYIKDVNLTINAKFVDKSPYDIFEQLRSYGVQYFVDNDFNFHFFENEGEVLGYAWDDNTSYLDQFSLASDISAMQNAVKITGSDTPKAAPSFAIIGTGDLTTGLDYTLPNNVVFSDSLYLDNWGNIDASIWGVSDTRGSTSPDSPDGSRIFNGNSALIIDGGNGIQGANYVQSFTHIDRTPGNVITQTMNFDAFGNGFIFGFSDGNGAADINLFGFYLKSDGTITVKENGIEYALTSTPIKRSFSGSTALTFSGIDSTRKIFNIQTGMGQFFSVGDNIVISGDSIGVLTTSISAITGDQVTTVDGVPVGDITTAKISRIADYRFQIQVKAAGFIYKIQGDGNTYGLLNSGSYVTLKETFTDVTPYLFTVPGAPKDANCKTTISTTFILPTGGATFLLNGQYLPVAPEDQGSAYDFPVLIRPANNQQNPPLFRYRPARLETNVSGSEATTSAIPITTTQFEDVFIGDRLLINKQETFITSKVLPNIINVAPGLSGPPPDGTPVYVGTTAAALNQNGVFNYNYPIPNRRYFTDQSSINTYGLFEGSPINDTNLKTSDDLNARWNAFKEANSTPTITGNVTFQYSPILDR